MILWPRGCGKLGVPNHDRTAGGLLSNTNQPHAHGAPNFYWAGDVRPRPGAGLEQRRERSVALAHDGGWRECTWRRSPVVFPRENPGPYVYGRLPGVASGAGQGRGIGA